jgi:hypothetical protein
VNQAEAKNVIVGAIVLYAQRTAQSLSKNDLALLNSGLTDAEAIEDVMLAEEGEENHHQEFEEVYAGYLNQALADANPRERSIILKAVEKISHTDQFVALVARHVSKEFRANASSLQVTIGVAILLLSVYVLLMMMSRVYGT